MTKGPIVRLTLTMALLGCAGPSGGDGAPAVSSRAATLPANFSDVAYVGGFTNVTAMEFAPDGRLFVCEQGGTVRVVKNGVRLATPFVTLPVNSEGERGLLGVTFDPGFASNGFVYVYYTATSPTIHNRLSRFVANGDVGGGETILLELDNLSGQLIHNGGALHFGADGKLYVAVGENGNSANAQSFNNLLGKMLRLNKDGSVPGDNPFLPSTTGKNQAIWALGLRNPFTFAVQSGTGRLFINDVGQGTWEEIDRGVAGGNYGWPSTEGTHTDPRYQNPIYVYSHNSGNECAITGGTFYNPATANFPASYVGDYFFADYCAQWIRTLEVSDNSVTTFASGIPSAIDLDVGPDGALYYLARSPGEVRKISFVGSGQAPQITGQPTNQQVAVGQPATFSVSASGSAPLAYQWQRNSVDIAGATAPTYQISAASSGDNGASFRARVSNSVGSLTSNGATLTVLNNAPPTAAITAPPGGTLYSAGDVINYAGTGTDPEDGTLPPGAFTWKVDFHHDEHTHPFMPATAGARSGSFTIANTGETSANVWYRIHLTVRDSAGLTSTVFVDIRPRTVLLQLRTQPVALQVTLDGQPAQTHLDVPSVVGMKRTLGVVSPQAAGGKTYVFDTWSDGGTGTHQITTPSVNTTYTATHRESQPSGLQFEAESGQITAPFVSSGGVVSQTATTTGAPAQGGKAVYTFNVPSAGDYVVRALVSAPGSTDNSVYVNIDAEPTEPVMVWDVPINRDLSWQTVNWRGNGTADASQYTPKVFTLTAGTHSLIIRGREPNTAFDRLEIAPTGASPHPPPPPPPPPTGSSLDFEAEAGQISSPFSVKSGVVSQTATTTGVPGQGGKAVYSFSAPAAGNYIVKIFVMAPANTDNSLYVNIDAEPTEPVMVWDVPVNRDFSWQTVNWRGNGTADASQFMPKIFALAAGSHTLVIRGREPNVAFDRISIIPQ